MLNPEFRKAVVPEEIPELLEFDRLVFQAHPADVFTAEEWLRYEAYWMVLDGKIVGCTAFQTDRRDELWIASTAILPEFRKQGLGAKLKEWQIEFARSHGFERIGALTRESNEAMISLNEKFGFKRKRIEPKLYSDPLESGVFMELVLRLPECPNCGQAVRTHRAKQCRACGSDWH